MEEKLYKGFLLLIYVVLMAAILDFNLILLINLRFLIYLIAGTTLLMLFYKKKVGKGIRWIYRTRLYLLITGCVITFLSQLLLLQDIKGSQDLGLDITINFIPIFYAMFFILLLDVFKKEEQTRGEKEEILVQPRKRQEDLTALFVSLNLSKREKAVALELLQNLSNKEIGDKLFISENTVKKHVHHIFVKAEVNNRTEFIQLCKE